MTTSDPRKVQAQDPLVEGGVLLTTVQASNSPVFFSWNNHPELVRFNAPFAPVIQPQHDMWFANIDPYPCRRMSVIRGRAEGSPLRTITFAMVELSRSLDERHLKASCLKCPFYW